MKVEHDGSGWCKWCPFQNLGSVCRVQLRHGLMLQDPSLQAEGQRVWCWYSFIWGSHIMRMSIWLMDIYIYLWVVLSDLVLLILLKIEYGDDGFKCRRQGAVVDDNGALVCLGWSWRLLGSCPWKCLVYGPCMALWNWIYRSNIGSLDVIGLHWVYGMVIGFTMVYLSHNAKNIIKF